MDKKGLTLLEILVSIMILSLVVTGLTHVFIAGKRHILRSRSRISAVELGRLFLDTLQMDVRNDTWTTTCLGGNSSACPATQTINNITYAPNYTISDINGTTLRKVKVNITWNESAFY